MNFEFLSSFVLDFMNFSIARLWLEVTRYCLRHPISLVVMNAICESLSTLVCVLPLCEYIGRVRRPLYPKCNLNGSSSFIIFIVYSVVSL